MKKKIVGLGGGGGGTKFLVNVADFGPLVGLGQVFLLLQLLNNLLHIAHKLRIRLHFTTYMLALHKTEGIKAPNDTRVRNAIFLPLAII